MPLTPTTITTAGSLGGGEIQAPVQAWVNQLEEFSTQHLTGALGIRDPVDAEFSAQRLGELRRGTDAQVRGDQRGLEVIPGLGIDPVDAEQIPQRPGKHVVA